jgi:hypothetical protein
VQKLGLLGQVAAAVPDAWPLLKADLFLREADRLHKAGVTGVLACMRRSLCQICCVMSALPCHCTSPLSSESKSSQHHLECSSVIL